MQCSTDCVPESHCPAPLDPEHEDKRIKKPTASAVGFLFYLRSMNKSASIGKDYLRKQMTGGNSFMKIKHVIALLLSVLCVSASVPQVFAA